MFFEAGGNIGRAIRQFKVLNSSRLNILDALLKFPNRFQIFLQLGSIAWAKGAIEPADFVQ